MDDMQAGYAGPSRLPEIIYSFAVNDFQPRFMLFRSLLFSH
jgi:hypothetical protein